MAVTEEDHYDMIAAFEEKVGRRTAMTLAESLPRGVDWSDIARRSEMNARFTEVEAGLNARIDKLDARITEVEAGLNARIDKLESTIRHDMLRLLITFSGVIIAAMTATMTAGFMFLGN